MLLSVVIPIGNLGRDYRNLANVVKSAPEAQVEFVFILWLGWKSEILHYFFRKILSTKCDDKDDRPKKCGRPVGR